MAIGLTGRQKTSVIVLAARVILAQAIVMLLMMVVVPNQELMTTLKQELWKMVQLAQSHCAVAAVVAATHCQSAKDPILMKCHGPSSRMRVGERKQVVVLETLLLFAMWLCPALCPQHGHRQ